MAAKRARRARFAVKSKIAMRRLWRAHSGLMGLLIDRSPFDSVALCLDAGEVESKGVERRIFAGEVIGARFVEAVDAVGDARLGDELWRSEFAIVFVAAIELVGDL